MNERDDVLALKFVKRIKQRLLYQIKNWLAIVCGETGSGKSYSALSLAKLISWNVHIVFTPVEFLRLLNSGKLKKGDVILFDEAGVGMASRDWYSVQNKLLGSVLQTFRNMNVAVIFTTPNLSFIDVQARKLFHNYFETVYLDFEEEEAYLKVYDIQVNSRFDKIYFKYPRFDVGGVIKSLAHIIVPKPDPDVIEFYEGRKLDYTTKLNAKALNDLLNPDGDKKQKKEFNVDELKEKVLSNPDDYLKEYNQRKFIDADLLRNSFDLTIAQANVLKKVVEKQI